MGVGAYQVTGSAAVVYTSKPQSGRTASRALRRQGAVSDLNLLAGVASAARARSNDSLQQTSVFIFNCLILDASTH